MKSYRKVTGGPVRRFVRHGKQACELRDGTRVIRPGLKLTLMTYYSDTHPGLTGIVYGWKEQAKGVIINLHFGENEDGEALRKWFPAIVLSCEPNVEVMPAARLG